jgi:DNA repair protein RecO (recombination protein O)
MLEKCRGIVLHVVNYSENSVVLKCYTDKFGMQSYMVSGVKGKKSSIKPSHLMPLSLLELEVYHQQNKGLQRIKELKCWPVLQTLHFQMEKQTLAMFVSEVLSKCLREEDQRDDSLFSYLFHTIQLLDLSEGSMVNFPNTFLLHLSKYLGFFPKENYNETFTDFSLQEGIFIANAPRTADYCNGETAKALANLCQLNFEESGNLPIPSQVRRDLLQKLIRYYQLHLMMFGDLKSPAVLHEVLS